MAGKRRDPAHRAIIYGGVLGGLTREEVNKMLAKVKERDLGESSYSSIRDHYVPYFKADLSRLGRAIQSPPKWSDLKKAGSGNPTNAMPKGDPTEDE
jgi:hypothetical protein